MINEFAKVACVCYSIYHATEGNYIYALVWLAIAAYVYKTER